MRHGRTASTAHRITSVDIISATAHTSSIAERKSTEAGRARGVGAGVAIRSERSADDAGTGSRVEISCGVANAQSRRS